jgi:hypothetical protein
MLRSSRWHKEEVTRAWFGDPFRFREGRGFHLAGRRSPRYCLRAANILFVSVKRAWVYARNPLSIVRASA